MVRLLLVLLVIGVFLASGCIGLHGAVPADLQGNCGKVIAKLPQIIRDNTGENSRLFEVSKVIDGDTIELSNGQRVRFLELNTPEKGMKWSAEATALTGNLTQDGVYLQKDAEAEDKYSRWLRYIFTNNSFVNAELVREGLATVFIVGNNTKYADLLKCLEQEAKENKKGIWSAVNKYDVNLFVNYDAEGSDNENLNGEFVIITNSGNSTINLQNWSIKDEATHIYTFQDMRLSPDDNMTLRTGSGDNSQTELYWNSKDPIWNNDGDTVFLFDANGDLAASVSFP